MVAFSQSESPAAFWRNRTEQIHVGTADAK